ncbi:heme exporter protein CcmB [Comamonas sp. CMM01]|jgi:heme exporter protein B|uniref:Heme exporter protein B n=1 Tax=Comamonas terrigena TaxID=32013 RepID=A0A2A7UV95_COMTR|nr:MULTISPECIES: heme exporter protein CcmB [Comamonas]MBD9530382.1 heme exporter protein CcmB [Comamonas sp. CMM01]MBV7420483.1 heme exporter protein CcmB [Comamonas sp. CMM03]PEH89111.1 heme exporter protein CcmB [Comamonas terrigena]SUY72182.1 Cytochrome c-type biogenesis protein CcmB [Comamonas terrigena]BBL24219.1 heme exporter protein B [Comamonas terrigena NBRC 13299]
MLAAVLGRELRLASRRPADALGGLLFFVLVGSLFPLALGPDANLLQQIAPGVMWVAALLAVLLGQHRLFEGDWADGSLEQWLLAPQPLPLLVLAKVAAHWLLGVAPLLLVAPLLGWQYGLDGAVIAVLLASLALGTPSLYLLAALGAALTLGLRGQLLLVLVVLPLSIPVLIFGSHAVAQAQQGLSAAPALNLLGAFLCLALLAGPWAIGAALRLALE